MSTVRQAVQTVIMRHSLFAKRKTRYVKAAPCHDLNKWYFVSKMRRLLFFHASDDPQECSCRRQLCRTRDYAQVDVQHDITQGSKLTVFPNLFGRCTTGQKKSTTSSFVCWKKTRFVYLKGRQPNRDLDES